MIKRELSVFLVVGALTVMLDFAAYRSLVWTAMVGIDLSKALGFLAGTLFAYYANKRWTFNHQAHTPGSVWRFALLYTITLGTNVLVNAACLAVLSPLSIATYAAFIIATALSAALNFLGMKFFVFKASAPPETS
jgi:putative flippase GtrA